jgi:hypothetical protein
METVWGSLALFFAIMLIVAAFWFVTTQREKNIQVVQPDTSVGSYLLTLEVIKKPIGPFNWDPFQQLYKTQFTIPVDKDYYNKVSVGDVIVNQPSTGPTYIKEAHCFWQLKVIGKNER